MNERDWLGHDNQLGIDIYINKYRHGNETFDEWLERVSGGNQAVKDLIIKKKFLFGGRILSNRGLDKCGIKTTLSNCYVIAPPEDNIESIFDCAKKLARTYSYGGGCGVDLSKLSPRGAKVNNTAKETSGAVSFMDLYSLVTGLIGQNGRRGALMLSISCEHPDLEEFIEIKSDLDRVTKANISIRITDAFMEAVKNKEMFVLSFTREETGETVEKEVDAYEIFHKICEMNWDYAEPGMLFWDAIENYNLLSEDEEFGYAGTNPCAEEPLPAGGSCLLGSINLSEFVKEDKTFDVDDFIETVFIAVDALNEVLDEGLPLHPLMEQRESVRDWRQIGLGIFGLADMLIKMEVKYGSPEAIAICDRIGNIMATAAIKASHMLAAENHIKYPKFKNCIMDSSFFTRHFDPYGIVTKEDISKFGLANSQLLTIAPTGSLSSMLGVSGGIEPVFANYYTRKTESLHGRDEYYKVYTPIVQQYMKEHDLTDDSDLPDFFITAQDLDYKSRIDMQSVWQSHIDASISSTVNVPNDFTLEEVEDLYMYAWEKGLKGVTIYRDGCARGGILTTDENKEEMNLTYATISDLPRGYIADVNDDLIGCKRKLNTGCGSIHMEVYSDELTGEPQETFINIGSSGGCERNYQFISRLISLALRGGIPIEAIIDQAMSIRPCSAYINRTKTKGDTSAGTSCPSAIGHALQDLYDKMSFRYFDDCKIVDAIVEEIEEKVTDPCPDCGAQLTFEGGCNICKNCGWSKCD